MSRTIYTVAQITQLIKDKLEGEPLFQDLWIEGEISNWKRSSAGHCYFTIKDDQAAIQAVMWRTGAARLSFVPQDGQAVVARGHVSVYEPRGQYQLYVNTLHPTGLGSLYLEFERLKERLAAEGLFDAERKRSLPSFPACVGIVTSATGAALRDILNVLSRRWPLVKVIVSPTLVQGERAAAQIVAALHALYARSDVDLIIVARGGGSIEDLWPFNDEQVAQAIVSSPVPVVSGVGHEVDFTIADFVADVRAPTPSAAAEVSVPDQVEVRGQLSALSSALSEWVGRTIQEARHEFEVQQGALARACPRDRIERDRQRVDEWLHRLEQVWQHRLTLSRERLSGMASRLEGLDPYAVLERGYAIVRTQDGEVIRKVSQVAAGELISVHVSDGGFTACVGDS